MQRRYRLTSSRSFAFLYRNGTCVRDKSLTLHYAPSKYGLKVGFSVSKKVGKSVVRNKTKRRLKENFRRLIPELKNGYTYLITAKPSLAECDFAQIGSALRGALGKAGLFKQ